MSMHEKLLIAMQTIIDAVKEGGSMGAPGGVMYAALMSAVSLEQFQTIMDTLVNRGYLRRQGQLYFFVRDVIVTS